MGSGCGVAPAAAVEASLDLRMRYHAMRSRWWEGKPCTGKATKKVLLRQSTDRFDSFEGGAFLARGLVELFRDQALSHLNLYMKKGYRQFPALQQTASYAVLPDLGNAFEYCRWPCFENEYGG